MNTNQANRYLANAGHADLSVHKDGGVYYLVGGSDASYDGSVERCLHVVRADDLTPELLDEKLAELVITEEDTE